jgi:hypothetical protein
MLSTTLCRLALGLVACSVLPASEMISSVNHGQLPGKEWAETLGVDPTALKESFSSDGSVRVQLLRSSIPSNVLWPGDKPELEVQIVNLTDAPVKRSFRVITINYESYTHPGDDVFKIGVRRIAEVGSTDGTMEVAAKGVQHVLLQPVIPERNGGYAVVLEMEGVPSRLFVTSLARTFKQPFQKRRFYKLTMDIDDVGVLRRLGAAPNRIGMAPQSPSSPQAERYYQEQAAKLRQFAEAGLPICIEFGHGAPWRGEMAPLGRNRPFLDDKGQMKSGMGDVVWMPAYDDHFAAFVKRLLVDFGWPKGPVNAVKIWNEPWNGNSISGWGADDERFRELTIAMDKGVRAARAEANIQVLQGGADSSSNTLDKYFSDGSDRFDPMFDFLSIHYQGNDPHTNWRAWRERKNPDGTPRPVLFWDTESWVANSEDRVAGVLATMYSFGQDRAVGIDSHNSMAKGFKRTVLQSNGRPVRGADGKAIELRGVHVSGVAAAVGAFQALVGEDRAFNRLLWHGLPFVLQFDGKPKAGTPDPEDGTIVVLGDMGFYNPDAVALRTARSLSELAGKRELRAQLAALPADDPGRRAIEQRLRQPWPLADCTMTLKADGGRFALYDFYGNPVPAVEGKIVVPLDGRGFYLRGNGRAGSQAALLKAIQAARLDGIEPLEKKLQDFTAPIASKPTMRIHLRNVLNRPVTGKLEVAITGLELSYPAELSLAAHEARTVEVAVTGGAANPENLYPLTLRFDAGDGVVSEHQEDMRVNQIARRSVVVDGKLDDWKDALPQSIRIDEAATVTMTERAWRPYENFDEGVKKGFSLGYLAWDDEHFYFAAKVADTTAHPGTLRFATMDPDQFFYPAVSTRKADPPRQGGGGAGAAVVNADTPVEELTWPEGVRRYSYRKDPVLPAGNAPGFDNIQLAFNVLPEERKKMISVLPGLFQDYMSYQCTDYEWALNKVADTYGGGTEVWRLRRPDMPHKHFYPRTLMSPADGPAPGAKLAVVYEGGWRITEVSIPWREMPEAKARLDAGQTVKFSYRVNDDQGVGCMELSKRRSVAKRGSSFMVDWVEHWTNELEFGAETAKP